MSDQYNEQTKPEGEFVEQFEETADQAHEDANAAAGDASDGFRDATDASLTAGEKFTPEKLGEAAIKFATETAYAAAGLANVLAEKAKEFYDAQRKEIAAKTPEGVDPNFRQFVDAMPDQFKGFMDEATKAFHEMAERGRVTVTDFQGQVQAARDAAKDSRHQPHGAFDLDDAAEATAEEEGMVAPDVTAPTFEAPVTDVPSAGPATDAYPGESKDEFRGN